MPVVGQRRTVRILLYVAAAFPGPATANQLVTRARENLRGDLLAASAAAAALERVPSVAARERLIQFGMGLQSVRAQLKSGRSLGHVVIAVVTLPGGLVAHHQHVRDHSPNPERRADAERVLEDLRSLCRAAQTFDEHNERATLTGFLDHAAGLHAQELDAATDRRITVSTIHRAKGTEAQLVVLLACEEQVLPSWRSVSSPDPERLAEERRLFYVAVTRAKDRLLITTPPNAAGALPAARRDSSPKPGSSTCPARWPPDTCQTASSRSARRLQRGRVGTTNSQRRLMSNHPHQPTPPARTHAEAAALCRRPFAPGAIGFRAIRPAGRQARGGHAPRPSGDLRGRPPCPRRVR